MYLRIKSTYEKTITLFLFFTQDIKISLQLHLAQFPKEQDYQGKVNMISTETPTKYFIYNDVVLYLLGTNTWKVWWNGTNY